MIMTRYMNVNYKVHVDDDDEHLDDVIKKMNKCVTKLFYSCFFFLFLLLHRFLKSLVVFFALINIFVLVLKRRPQIHMSTYIMYECPSKHKVNYLKNYVFHLIVESNLQTFKI